MRLWLEASGLRDITLFCQDWGGLIGLRLVAVFLHGIARVVTANTFLPTSDHPPEQAFPAWKEFTQQVPVVGSGRIVQRVAARTRSDAEVSAYDAPYPDESYKAGARKFPLLMPAPPDDPDAAANRTAWFVLSQWNKPWLTLFSDQDPIIRGADRLFQKLVPGCSNPPHEVMQGRGHFLPEDVGVELAERMLAWMK